MVLKGLSLRQARPQGEPRITHGLGEWMKNGEGVMKSIASGTGCIIAVFKILVKKGFSVARAGLLAVEAGSFTLPQF